MPATVGVWRRLPIPFAFLTDFIAVEKPTSTSDGQGGYTNTWTTIASNIRAIVRDSSPPRGNLGGESVALGMSGEHITHKIWIRYTVAGLDSTCNVIFNSKRFRVHDVNSFGGNTLIQAEEVRQ